MLKHNAIMLVGKADGETFETLLTKVLANLETDAAHLGGGRLANVVE